MVIVAPTEGGDALDQLGTVVVMRGESLPGTLGRLLVRRPGGRRHRNRFWCEKVPGTWGKGFFSVRGGGKQPIGNS